MKPIEWLGNKLRILDQTKLPQEEVYLELSSYQQVAQAIKEMRVRGAPAIGVIAAYGIALGAQSIKPESKKGYLAKLHLIFEALASTRPTAVNLFKTIERMKIVAQGGK